MLFYKHLLSSMHTIYCCCYGHSCQSCCYCCCYIYYHCLHYHSCYCCCCYCIGYCCYCCYYCIGYCCCCYYCCIGYCCCYCCCCCCCIGYCCCCCCYTYYFVSFDRSPLIIAHLFLLKIQSLYSTYYKQRHYFYSFSCTFSAMFSIIFY